MKRKVSSPNPEVKPPNSHQAPFNSTASKNDEEKNISASLNFASSPIFLNHASNPFCKNHTKHHSSSHHHKKHDKSSRKKGHQLPIISITRDSSNGVSTNVSLETTTSSHVTMTTTLTMAPVRYLNESLDSISSQCDPTSQPPPHQPTSSLPTNNQTHATHPTST